MKNPSSRGGLQSTALRSMLVLLLGTGVSSAASFTYRYYRFTPTKLRSSATLIQLADFNFYNSSVSATAINTAAGVTVTDPNNNDTRTATSETPEKVLDANSATKWLDRVFTSSNLTFDFGAPTTIDSYNYVTGNDATDRDPVSWIFEGSSDNTNWTVLDTRTNAVITTARKTIAATTNFVLPAAPAPTIVEFGFNDVNQSFIIKNGTTTNLYAQTSLATSATVTSSAGGSPITVPSPNDGAPISITPPSDADTTYTLSATSPGGTVSQSVLVRTVSGATQNYRYIRYTPVTLRGGGVSIQMSNFEFHNAGVKVPVSSVSTTAPVQTGEEVAKLIDTDNPPTTVTKWFSGTKAPVIFDFGSVQSFDSYVFATANDFPDRDPVQWYIEGSNDNTTWTLIENMANITYPTTTTRNTTSGELLFPGTSVVPTSSFSTDSKVILAGDSAVLTYATAGASSVSITPGGQQATTSGTLTVSPTTTTTYTLTSFGGPNLTGRSSTATVTVNVAVNPTGVINYPNFETAPEISPVGSASIVNDFATFPADGNVKRLRITPFTGGQTGAAWSVLPVKLTDGFDTTFAIEPTGTYLNGADGMSFIIQNTAAKYRANVNGALYLPANAVSVAFDAYLNGADTVNNIPADPSNASVGIWTGSTRTAVADLSSAGFKVAKGSAGNYLTISPLGAAAPYQVHINYTAGKLNVFVDSVQVITDLAIDLAAAGAVDANGYGYVGFAGRTGGLAEYQDVLNWVLTPTVVTPANPLAITSSVFTFGASPSVALTWSSNAGKTYRITESSDLVTWVQVGTNVAGSTSSSTTSTTVPFTQGSKDFFRVEEVATP